MATQPLLMSVPFANAGAKNDIPQNTTSLGKASLTNGFPTETSMPIDDGGVPPQRADFNGMLYWLSTFAMFQQSGGKFSYDASINYDVPSIIYHNGDLWWCLQSNGPATVVKAPGSDSSFWIKFRNYISSPLDAYPIGSYFISSVPTNPADPTMLGGGTWEQVQDRMILAAGTKYSAGDLINPRLGGSATKTIPTNALPYHTHSITINKNGLHTHNVTGSTQYAGSHTHQVEGSTQGAGSHTHTITTNGNHHHGAMGENSDQSLYGFYSSTRNHIGTNGNLDNDNTVWKTSTDGAHNHTASIISNHTHDIVKTKVTALENGSHFHTVNITVASNGEHIHTGSANGAGENKPMDIMPPYIVAYVWRRIA